MAIRVLSVVLVLTACGIGAFWANWFASGAFQTATPECFRLWENTFPLPDGVLALLMVMTAVDAWRHRERTLLWGAIAAGMASYLGAVDLCFHWQQDNFSDWSDLETWSRAGIVVVMWLLAPAIVVSLWKRVAVVEGARGRTLLILSGVFLLYAVAVSAFWLFVGAMGEACERVFIGSFELTDWASVVMALIAAWGCYRANRWGYWFGVMVCAGFTFGSLNFAGFYVQTSVLAGESPAIPLAVCIGCAVLGWAGVFVLWGQYAGRRT